MAQSKSKPKWQCLTMDLFFFSHKMLSVDFQRKNCPQFFSLLMCKAGRDKPPKRVAAAMLAKGGSTWKPWIQMNTTHSRFFGLSQQSDLQSTLCDTFRHHWVNSTQPFCCFDIHNIFSTNPAWTIKSSAASVCLCSCWKPCRCPVSYHKIDIALIHPPTALHSVRRPECVKSSQRNRETDSLCLTDSKGRDGNLFETVEAESH